MGDEPVIVLDTHVLIWWLADPRRLSAAARRALAGAAPALPACLSAISVLEIVTAGRRGRLALTMPVEQWLADACSLPELRVEPVSGEIALRAGQFGDEMHGDPADRLIAATALVLAAPLVSADRQLRQVAGLKVIW